MVGLLTGTSTQVRTAGLIYPAKFIFHSAGNAAQRSTVRPPRRPDERIPLRSGARGGSAVLLRTARRAGAAIRAQGGAVAGRPNIAQMIDLPTKPLRRHDVENERGDMNVPCPIRCREVAYSGRGGPETPGGLEGWLSRRGARRPVRLCDRFVTCPSEFLVCRLSDKRRRYRCRGQLRCLG